MPAGGPDDTVFGPSGPLAAGRAPLDHTRLAAARLRAADAQPFLAIALYALTPVADDSCQTFAVDERWRVHVNPAKLAEWSIAEVAGVLLHEVSHVLRDHAGRARTANAASEQERLTWNVAADAEINDDLLAAMEEDPRAAELALPESPVTPQALGLPPGKVAEFYYAVLRDRADPPHPVPDCGPGSHGAATGLGAGADLAAGLPGGLLAGVAAGFPPGLSAAEVLLLRRKVAVDIARLGGSNPGSAPGGWLRWAQAQLRPRLDWRRLLSAKVRSCAAAVSGAADYSYARPPRRRVPGVVLPAMRRPLPRVAVIVDTSGSVTDELLELAWTEVHGCLRHLGIRRDLLTVYAADTEARVLTGAPRRQVALHGGGGTDMAEAIGAVLGQRPAPDLVVVITDGLTPWPPERPGLDVIVALLPLAPGCRRPPVPPWAHVVEVTAPGDATEGVTRGRC